MALQTRDLWMTTLGVLGDVPDTPLQEKLPDGMHMRWAFAPVKGFPWHGYYLFRRPSKRGRDRTCISRYVTQYQPGTAVGASLALGPGVLGSDQPLVLTDDFPPAGVSEVDLAGRRQVTYDLPLAEPAYSFEATIGFGRGGEPAQQTCVDFRREHPVETDNPLEREGARFVSFDVQGAVRSTGRLGRIGALVGWDVGFRAEIDLPCAASWVEVELVVSARPAKVVALDAAGNAVDSAGMTGTAVQSLTLTGAGIAAVQVFAEQDETILARVCWVCGDGEKIEIALRASFGGVTVATAMAAGRPGDVVTVPLTADAITGVWIGPGPAALIDLCFATARQGLRAGEAAPWEALDTLKYPLCLPVADPGYPCPGAPGSSADAESTALGRVVYGPPTPWAGASFAAMHDRLEALVRGGPPPGGPAMADRTEPTIGSPAPPPEIGGDLLQQRQRPLDLLLLASLRPPVAQQLGLYWWDKSALPGVPYDYLLIADHDGSLGGTAASGLAWVNTIADFTVNDGFVAFARVVGPAAPLPAPTDLRGYALPGATLAPDGGGAVLDATNNVGLTWNRQFTGGVLDPGAPVLYHVWRAELGNVESPGTPADGDFAPITAASPLPVGTSILMPPQTAPQPADWPPFPLQYIDRARPDGWYAYRVNGVDLFGRHSAPSTAAQWRQWAPGPAPRPWYYQDPPSGAVIDPRAIRLLDKVPPPPPTGVEAFALDPDDPAVTKDAAWRAWRAGLTPAERLSVIGLRVRWHWDLDQQRQAPDTREFRVYYQPAPMNTVRGRVASVAAAGATQSDVVTDIANSAAANAYTGLSVRIGAQSFRIVTSEPGSPLRVRVQNLGPTGGVQPPDRSRAAVSLPLGHPLAEDFSAAPAWQDRMITVAYADHVQVDAGRRWYELFLPLVGSPERVGLPLITTLDEPVAAGAVAVTAVDDKQHTSDHRGDPARFGNESRVGGPATVLRVRRVKPTPPSVPPDSAKVWASKADYHGHSFYTYRWQPATHLKTFVYRALDDAVFRADGAARPRPVLAADDLQFFPLEADEPTWTALKRQQVATELNALNGLSADASRAAYRALSIDGLRVLAGLPGLERVFVQLTPLPLDPDEPDPAAPDRLRWRRVGPDVPATVLAAGQRAYVDALDGKAGNRSFYRCAYVDEVHNVGALSRSSPPVWLPDVTAPTAPRMARVAAGNRRITLEWSSNREPDLAAYQVYRTLDEPAARDVRLMTLVATVPVPVGDPAARPRTVSWVDDPVPGLRDLWYRVVALDRVDPDPKGGGGNVSAPTPAVRTRAFDETPPEPPVLDLLRWVRLDPAGTAHPWATPVPPGQEWVPAVQVGWAPVAPGDRLLLQVKGEYDEGFSVASPWLTGGTAGVVQRTGRTAEALTYRLKAVSSAGNANVVWHPTTLDPPV